MTHSGLTRGESHTLLALAILGLFLPNGIFLYTLLTAPGLMAEALANPIAAVFMAEALVLLGLCAWWLARAGSRRPNWLGFVVLSLIGGLVFSVPFTLYRIQGRSGDEGGHR